MTTLPTVARYATAVRLMPDNLHRAAQSTKRLAALLDRFGKSDFQFAQRGLIVIGWNGRDGRIQEAYGFFHGIAFGFDHERKSRVYVDRYTTWRFEHAEACGPYRINRVVNSFPRLCHYLERALGSTYA